jgi:hypothetical protein
MQVFGAPRPEPPRLSKLRLKIDPHHGRRQARLKEPAMWKEPFGATISAIPFAQLLAACTSNGIAAYNSSVNPAPPLRAASGA